jgi:hypothetical protein
MPFPIEVDTPTDTTYYPIAMPKGRNALYPGGVPVTDTSIARLGWRARFWTLTTDAIASDGSGSIFFPGGELNDLSGRTTESEIVLIGYGSQFHFVTDPTPGLSYLFNFEMFGDPNPKCWLDGSDYKPQIDTIGNLQIDDGGGNGGTVEFSTRAGSLSGAPDGSFSGTLAGEAVTIYYILGSSGAGSSSISTFSLEPTTFWSWDGKYDTSTGDFI